MRKKSLKPLQNVLIFQDLGMPGYAENGQYHNPYKNAFRQMKKNWNSIPRPNRQKAKQLLIASVQQGISLAPPA